MEKEGNLQGPLTKGFTTAKRNKVPLKIGKISKNRVKGNNLKKPWTHSKRECLIKSLWILRIIK